MLIEMQAWPNQSEVVDFKNVLNSLLNEESAFSALLNSADYPTNVNNLLQLQSSVNKLSTDWNNFKNMTTTTTSTTTTTTPTSILELFL
jgi:hypothetical protein